MARYTKHTARRIQLRTHGKIYKTYSRRIQLRTHGKIYKTYSEKDTAEDTRQDIQNIQQEDTAEDTTHGKIYKTYRSTARHSFYILDGDLLQTTCLYWCPNCPNCQADLNSIGWATWAISTTIKKYSQTWFLRPLKGMKNCGLLGQVVNYSKKCTFGDLQGWSLNTGSLKGWFDCIALDHSCVCLRLNN